jgi:hypothetical protein
MAYKEFKSDIEAIKKAHGDWVKVYDKLSDIFGCNCEGVIIDMFDGLYDTLVDVVSDKYNDKHEWIKWFVYDNDFGKCGLEAVIGRKKLVADSVKKLFKIMETQYGKKQKR